MSEEQQYKAFILQAIDQLRQRKARPDFERICHIVSRRQGLTVAAIETQLNKLVEEGSVAKVDYKGNTSYRNMAKWSKRGSKRRAKISLKTHVLKAFKALLAEKSRARALESEQKNGEEGGTVENVGNSVESSEKHVSFTLEEIEKYLARSDAAAALTGNALCGVLDKLVADNVLSQMSHNEYVLIGKGEEGGGGRRSFSPGDGGDAETDKAGRFVSQSPSSPSGASSADDNSRETPASPPAVTKLPARRGRPPGSGKGKKRTLPVTVGVGRRASAKAIKKDEDEAEGGAGSADEWRMADVEAGEDGDMSNDSNTTIVDARCDFCQMTAAENQRGISEPLLFCKDCPAKAHPSCMDYSDELARRARRSPWQCMECKTCSLCSDAGDPDTLLFCDSCDKGYHMNCHQPPLSDKPLGKWVCRRCEQDSTNGRHSETLYQDDNVGLPTPRQSPVQFRDGPISRTRTGKSSTSSASPPLTTPAPPPVPDASGWTVADVVQYFTSIGFENDAHVFQDQDIDGKSMLLMRRQDVVEGLSLKLGIALKMFARIQRLQDRGQSGV